MDILKLIGRDKELFIDDINSHESGMSRIIEKSRFLVLGGAGTIGQAVVKEIFSRNPKKLHVVDISENNLVELVRDIRSSYGYISGEFQTYALDVGSCEYDAFFRNDGKYDYVLNLSALKHVRSEKDPYTLMRMINVNILNTKKTIEQSIRVGVKKYFCVSTDKAANPVNMMGASKRIMEMYLMKYSSKIEISTARFANVAFSDGSLLHSFNQRIQKKQPIVAPNDIKRYFVTPKESGELCLMSCIYGQNRDVYFPKLDKMTHLTSFADIAVKYLAQLGYDAQSLDSEESARENANNLSANPSAWPCYFSVSDTTGEKDYEEFYTSDEVIDLDAYASIGVIKNPAKFDQQKLDYFEATLSSLENESNWVKQDYVDLFYYMLPEFAHKETGKYLDSKM